MLALIVVFGIVVSIQAQSATAAGDPVIVPSDQAGSAVQWYTAGPFYAPNAGQLGCLDGASPACDLTELVLEQPATVRIELHPVEFGRSTDATVEDHDLRLLDAGGNALASSAEYDSSEIVEADLAIGTYQIEVTAFLDTPGDRIQVAVVSTPIESANGGQPYFDDEVACLEAAPESLEPAAPSIPSDIIPLHVAVVIDGGLDETVVSDLFDEAARSYSPLGIELTHDVVGAIELSVDHVNDDTPATSAADAIAQTRLETGGTRSTLDADMVYTVTPKDIFSASGDRSDPNAGHNYGVVGHADCIGGVRYDSRAYAISEVNDALEEIALGGPLVAYRDARSDTIAHELGHLLGAHHHYANCVEGIPTETPDDDGAVETSPCTLMTNFVDLTSYNFSTFSGSVVRGHAAAHVTQPRSSDEASD